MGWTSTKVRLPREEVIVWAESRMRIAIFVEPGPDAEDREPFCMDPRNDELLRWPSHWHELPPEPAREG